MTTPSASARVRPRKSKFSQRTLQITVGPEKEPFYVHVSHLEERTSFFEVHRRPQGMSLTAESPGTVTSTGRDQTLSPNPIKSVAGTTDDTQGDNDPQLTDGLPELPVYHLEGFNYEPAAFEVVVNWLYNQLPGPPKDRRQCRNLLRAYILAIQYRVVDLQDALVDCIRQYHQDFNILFEDLMWVINRIGESEHIRRIPMVRYFIDQCAWEVYSQGYKAFADNNPLFESFLETGDRPVRKALFEALTEVSRNANATFDPATGPNRYKVHDFATFQQPSQDASQIITLDD